MSTSSSPLSKLKAEADRIVVHLKKPNMLPNKPRIKFGVIMDDKTIFIEMDRQTILDTDATALSEMIVREMQGRTANT